MIDFPTLAELAEEIAPGDEDRPRPTVPRQGRFLAEMGEGGCHHQLVASFA
jgi:hypothetical protein